MIKKKKKSKKISNDFYLKNCSKLPNLVLNLEASTSTDRSQYSLQYVVINILSINSTMQEKNIEKCMKKEIFANVC